MDKSKHCHLRNKAVNFVTGNVTDRLFVSYEYQTIFCNRNGIIINAAIFSCL